MTIIVGCVLADFVTYGYYSVGLHTTLHYMNIRTGHDCLFDAVQQILGSQNILNKEKAAYLLAKGLVDEWQIVKFLMLKSTNILS